MTYFYSQEMREKNNDHYLLSCFKQTPKTHSFMLGLLMYKNNQGCNTVFIHILVLILIGLDSRFFVD